MDEHGGTARARSADRQREATTPDGLPVLSAGPHRRPERGSCVMEYVSVLAGERWSDRPRCTDRALGDLARLVNDDVRADARPALALLAPRLVGAVGPSSAMDVVLAAAARVGLEEAPDDPALERLRRRALARLGRAERRGRAGRSPRLVRALSGADVVAVYFRLARALAGAPRAERDAARIRALAAAVEDVRRYVGAAEEPRRRGPRTDALAGDLVPMP